MRICMTKAGKLIEMQSDAAKGTLIQNALNAGYKEDEIEEREITQEEWALIWEFQKPIPTYRELRGKEYPDFKEYFLDSQVKKASPDPAMQKEGLVQEKVYFEACLAVKKKYPKP